MEVWVERAHLSSGLLDEIPLPLQRSVIKLHVGQNSDLEGKCLSATFSR